MLKFDCMFVLFGGDFRQVLPVMPHASSEEIIAHSLRNHRLWTAGLVRVFTLTGNVRAQQDPEYAEFLLRLGDGAEPVHADLSPFAVRLPPPLCAQGHSGAGGVKRSRLHETVAT